MMLQPDNNLKIERLFWALALLLTIVFFWLFGGCEDKTVKVDPLSKIYPKIKKRDVLKQEAKRQDSIRIVYKDRWHKAKEDSKKLPCDSALPIIINACDSVVFVDSTEIVALKNVIAQDSLIQKDYKEQVDSLKNVNAKLEKQVKREKLKTKGVLLLWGLREAAGVGAKIKG